MESTPAQARATTDIRLEVYVLDPSLLLGSEAAAEGAAIPLADDVKLRLLGTERYTGSDGPHVMSFAVDFPDGAAPPTLAEALWRYVRARRGGRGIVTAKVMRRRERRAGNGAEAQVLERHELWSAIPLRSDRQARRRLTEFFEEVLAPATS